MSTRPDAPPNQRTLTVGLFTGLADRLKALLSAIALSKTTGRRLAVHWARTVHCGAAFSELAAFGRGVPSTLCRSSNALLHLRPLWLWVIGRMPTPAARFYYGRLLRQWLP